MTIANAIILRDIPKEEARLDLLKIQIQGGFRGFYSEAPIVGWHYVSVKVDQAHTGFWCYLSPNQALVRVFDAAGNFVEDEPDSAQNFARMALNGAMNQALFLYPPQSYAQWFGLVSHLSAENFPPTLQTEDTDEGSRFAQAFQNTHQGQATSFLAEFQYAFVRWLVSLDTAEDKVAFARWRHLLLSIYNAGEHSLREAGDLFAHLVDILMRQFDLLPIDWFTPDSFLIEHASYMAEDMIDSDIPKLMDQGRVFSAYLKKHTA